MLKVGLGLWSILGAVLLGASGCDTGDAPPPAYFELERPRIVFAEGDTLRDTLGLTDGWLFHGGEYLGTFELPARVPTVRLGQGRAFFRAGVKVNGNPLERDIFPYIGFDTLELPTPLEVGRVYRFAPVLRYLPDTLWVEAYREDFEAPDLRLQNISNRRDVATLVRSTQSPFRGSQSGRVEFDSTRRFLELESTSTFQLSNLDQPWAQVTFRGNIKFGLYLSFIFGSQIIPATSIIVPAEAPPGERWQTVYFNLNKIVGQAPAGSLFRLYLRTENADGANRYLELDDIRILYFR